jgi:hypothetical protein
MNYIKDLQGTKKSRTIESPELITFYPELLKAPVKGR